MRRCYLTAAPKLHLDTILPLTRKLFRLGLPLGLGQLIEICAHLFFLRINQQIGSEQFALTAIAQSLHMLLMFVEVALHKSVSTICANALGNGQSGPVGPAIGNSLSLVLLCALLLLSRILLNYRQLLRLFLSDLDGLHFSSDPHLIDTARLTLDG